MNTTQQNLKSRAVEIIPDKLYWVSEEMHPVENHSQFFFNIDQELVYQPYFSDFGPLDLGKIHRYVVEVERLVNHPALSDTVLYHHTSTDAIKRTNAAFLMGTYQVLILKRTAEEAWEPFANVKPELLAYRDASEGKIRHHCTILDCLKGLEYAVKLGWFNVRKFDRKAYDHHGHIKNGDMNWIIPGKFLALSGPSSVKVDQNGHNRFTPEDYCPVFNKFGITQVIRLNDREYEEHRFRKSGIKHQDLYFDDMTSPSDALIEKFFNICEKEQGAIAVHCKAGLGRTGVMIACYAMKHYRFPAAAFIGWIRLCRPGSILGSQQKFLLEKEKELHAQSDNSLVYDLIKNVVGDGVEEKDSEEIVNTPRIFQCMVNRSNSRVRYGTVMLTRHICEPFRAHP